MQPSHGGKSRTWYVVSPVGARWQVEFGSVGTPFHYATSEEALEVACAAAKLHWQDRGEPAGARLDFPDGTRRVVATYGRMAPVAAQRLAG
jgi:hypothetical protein